MCNCSGVLFNARIKIPVGVTTKINRTSSTIGLTIRPATSPKAIQALFGKVRMEGKKIAKPNNGSPILSNIMLVLLMLPEIHEITNAIAMRMVPTVKPNDLFDTVVVDIKPT